VPLRARVMAGGDARVWGEQTAPQPVARQRWRRPRGGGTLQRGALGRRQRHPHAHTAPRSTPPPSPHHRPTPHSCSAHALL
jgi:hypothetical protein